MKIHILNDLHLESGDFIPPSTDADVVVLAGDIGIGCSGLDWIGRHFVDKPVVYIPGEHEYYHHDTSLTQRLGQEAPDNVYVIDNDVVLIDGVRFLGSTLWTDFLLFGIDHQHLAMRRARSGMPGFSLIAHRGKPFTPEDALRLHEESHDWLAYSLAQPYAGKTVVVTHYAPSPGSVHPRLASDPLTPAFVTDLDRLMDASRVALWVHGHTHDAFDYTVQGTRVVCNPRGYAPDRLSEGFRPDLVLEI